MIKIELVNCLRDAYSNNIEHLLSVLNDYSFKSYNTMPDDWKKGFYKKCMDILNYEISKGIYDTNTAADYIFVEVMSLYHITYFDKDGFVVGRWNQQKTAPLFDDLLVKVIVDGLEERLNNQNKDNR